MSLAERIAAHRAYWEKRKPPPRTAEIVYVIDDTMVELRVKVSAAKLDLVRSLFPAKSDDEIVAEIFGVVLAQVGIG